MDNLNETKRVIYTNVVNHRACATHVGNACASAATNTSSPFSSPCYQAAQDLAPGTESFVPQLDRSTVSQTPSSSIYPQKVASSSATAAPASTPPWLIQPSINLTTSNGCNNTKCVSRNYRW